MFRGCEVLTEGIVLKANLIPLKMWDFDVILGMDWLSTHRALLDCFKKKVAFHKPGFLKLEFESDRKVLPTCVVITIFHSTWMITKINESRHRSFLYGCDRSPKMHVLKLRTKISNLNKN